MAGIYKLIFDFALYYTLTGFYTYIFFAVPPSTYGLLLLILAVALYELILRHWKKNPTALKVVLLCLPLITLATKPSLWQMIQLLPAWAYLGYCLFSEKTEPELGEFRGHFAFGLEIMLVMLPGFILSKRSVDAFICVIPFLTVMLAVGVSLLRMLREKTQSAVKQGIYIAVFVVACAALTVGRAPQLVLLALKGVYKYTLAPLLLVLAVVLGGGFYVVFKGLGWLVSLLPKGEQAEAELDLRSGAEQLKIENAIEYIEKDFPFVRYMLYVLAALAVLLILFLIFRRLLGKKGSGESRDPYVESREGTLASPRRRRPGLTRPRDPRLAVRFYYARFMRECLRRGVDIRPGMTSEEVTETCGFAFPGADASDLQLLYAPARYSDREPVSPADADRAAAAWHALKRTKTRFE